jgi:hypothetical protein
VKGVRVIASPAATCTTREKEPRHSRIFFRHNKGSKMMDNSIDNSTLIAFLMEATGASIEDVTLALENCGGNDQQALELLTGGGTNRNAPSVHSSTKKGRLPRSLVDEDAEMVAVKAPLRSEQGESKPPSTGKKSCEFFFADTIYIISIRPHVIII